MRHLVRVCAAMWLVFLCCTSNAFAQNGKDNIVLWNQNYLEGHSLQFVTLLADLSVEKFGEYTLEPSAPLEQGRAIRELKKQHFLNVAVMGNDSEREALIEPIYYPVDKGALGLRVCLIRKGDQVRFNQIRDAESARASKLIFGLGSYWPDTPIHITNGFTVLSLPVFDDLFDALHMQRFDCLSRSISEATMDQARFGEHHFDVEQRLAFVYPLANFIYTADPNLKSRFEYGLQRALETGELERLSQHHLSEEIENARFFSRHLIILQNPKLSDRAREAINSHGIMSFEQSRD